MPPPAPVRLRIDYDVKARLDQAVDLVRHAGRMNFTKLRLPEDRPAARAALAAQLDEFSVFTGLLQAEGDERCIGFFFVTGRFGQAELRHFCFTDSGLGTGVAGFLYRWLGTPKLRARGDVAGNPTRDAVPDGLAFVEEAERPVPAKLIDRLVVRGGCDMFSLLHYLGALAEEVHVELNTARDGRQFRIDNAAFLNLALAPPPPPVQSALEEIGYIRSDWRSALSLPIAPGSRTVWVLSFWTDAFVYLYKHRTLDLAVPFLMVDEPLATEDVTLLSPARLEAALTNPASRRAHAALQRDFCGIGPMFRELLETNLGKLLAAAGGRAMVVILLAPERWQDASRNWHERPKEVLMNSWIRAAMAGSPDAHVLEFAAFVRPEDVSAHLYHYGRLVYARAAAHLKRMIEQYQASPEPLQKTGS